MGADTAAPPTLEQVRKEMGIPSTATERGQMDAVGFASTKAQMDAVWKASEALPAPDLCKAFPPPAVSSETVAGIISPHDDYVYAGRVYRAVTPHVKAPLVILVGVFHHYRQFQCRNVLVFEDYRTWRSPDGPIQVSPLRDEVLARLAPDDFIRNDAMHDSEHSVEAISYWLKRQNPRVEILPFLVPEMAPEQMKVLASRLAKAVTAATKERNLSLGRDYQVVISADAVHYGADFDYTPFGEGGVEAYSRAVAQDLDIMKGPLAGELKPDEVFAALSDPEKPDKRRVTWCGRFSIPFGLAFMKDLAGASGQKLEAEPAAYATSIGWPELNVGKGGPGRTAPSNLYHFVGYPGVVIKITNAHS
ncbi:MAG: AmmeMemoRadiSam system protein B [Acidobacteria bacterium]|nr:AmmeMemoRadiSam system protein B [Acidobacteriota bacterium]